MGMAESQQQLDQQPESPIVLYEQACTLLQQGQEAQAETLLLQLVNLPSARAEGHFLPDLSSFLGEILSNRYAQLDWNLNWQDMARFLLSQLYWQQGRQHEALGLLRQQLYTSPSAEGYHQLARWLLELERREEALLALGQALQRNPAYLPAYEDLAMLANLNGDSDLAFRIIQQAMEYELSPRLLQELLLASSRQDFVPMRSLFLELCVYLINAETKPLLIPLLQRLYAEGDLHHAGYLASHMLQAFPNEREILNLYVLTLLRQRQYAPAIQALLRNLDSQSQSAEHWLKLGIAYSLWKMPLFASYALQQCLLLNPKLEAEVRPWREQLPAEQSLDSSLSQILRQIMLQSSFRELLRQDPLQALGLWGIEAEPALLDILAGLPDLSQLEQASDLQHDLRGDSHEV